MPRPRDPRRDQALGILKEHKGEITNREIAKQLNLPEKTISGWKSKDKWNGVLQTNKRSTPKPKGKKQQRAPSTKQVEKPIAESDELTEKQRLFCLYYMKYWNATKAYRKAYGCAYSTAMVEGSRHLRNPKISATIEQYKADLTAEKLLDAKVVLQRYIDIAFVDITDYLSFGQRDQQAMGMYGPVTEKNSDGLKVLVMETVNFVDLNEFEEIDGSIISEVKQGRDGISVKLADKMKALEMLTKYFDLLSETQQELLKAEKMKAVTAKATAETARIRGDDDDDYEDDGFLDALNGKAADVWNDHIEDAGDSDADA